MRKPKSRLPAVFGGVLVMSALAAVGVIVYLVWALQKECCLDDRLCPEAGPTGYVALLVDATDPISEGLAASVRTELDRIIRQSPAGTLIALAMVRPPGSEEAAVLERCHPGDPDQANPLYQNPKQIAEKFEDEFIGPLHREIDALLSMGTADTSPIAESMQKLAHEVLARDPRPVPRRIVLASDLVQHSETFSFFRGNTWESFRASPGYDRLGRSLKGVDVQFLRIPRQIMRRNGSTIEQDDVWEFWVGYSDVQGAASIDRSVRIGDF